MDYKTDRMLCMQCYIQCLVCNVTDNFTSASEPELKLKMNIPILLNEMLDRYCGIWFIHTCFYVKYIANE